MKYLIIFLLSLNIFAAELPQDEVAKEQIKELKLIDFESINTTHNLGLTEVELDKLNTRKAELIKERLNFIFVQAIRNGRATVERNVEIAEGTTRINKYSLQDNIAPVLDRLIPNAMFEFSKPTVGVKENLYTRLKVYKIVDDKKVYLEKPTLAEFNAEFATYKQELINAL